MTVAAMVAESAKAEMALPEMQEGQRVAVRLHSDETWYEGVVLDRPRKMWVQLEAYPGGEFIADEGCIAQWRPIPDPPKATLQYESWLCQDCGAPIGYLGRFSRWLFGCGTGCRAIRSGQGR